MPKIRFPLCTIALVLLFAFAPAIHAGRVGTEDFRGRSRFFAVNIGFLGKGELRTKDEHSLTQPGFTFGIKFDFRIKQKWYWGISTDVHRIHVQDTGQYFLDAGLHLKKMLYNESSTVALRPGIGLGFGHLMNFRKVGTSTYLTTRATLELLVFGEGSAAWFLEVGLLGAPVGGNSSTSMTFGPVALARIGAIF